MSDVLAVLGWMLLGVSLGGAGVLLAVEKNAWNVDPKGRVRVGYRVGAIAFRKGQPGQHHHLGKEVPLPGSSRLAAGH